MHCITTQNSIENREKSIIYVKGHKCYCYTFFFNIYLYLIKSVVSDVDEVLELVLKLSFWLFQPKVQFKAISQISYCTACRIYLTV